MAFHPGEAGYDDTKLSNFMSIPNQQYNPAGIQVNSNASFSIDKLVEALANAQLAFQPIPKTKENKFFGSMYADLEDVISATRPHLAAHGLVVFQLLETTPDGKAIVIHTKLAHKSNQWIESKLTMPIGPKIDHQAIGSASTYGRKYAYQAIIGVAAELDDDGNKNHSEDPEKPKKPKYEPKPGKVTDKVELTGKEEYHFTPEGPKPVQKPDGPPKAQIPAPPVYQVPVPELAGDFPNKEEMAEFVKRARKYTKDILPKLGVEDAANVLLGYISKKTGISDTKLLSSKQWSEVLGSLDSAYSDGKLKEMLT